MGFKDETESILHELTCENEMFLRISRIISVTVAVKQ